MVAAWVGWAITAGLIAAYALVVVALYRAGRIGPDRALSLLGPLLMMKTRRGRSLLDRLGRFRRFWSVLGDIGLLLAGVAMVLIVVTLSVEAVLALRLTPAQAPTPSEALGLPGINPFIPLTYGLVAIVVGIVIHELFHGIVARSQNIGVKSLGILWLVVPIGAFVEQDDVQMQAASRRARDRVAAAGILANFLLAAVTFFLLALLLTTSVQPAASGVGVVQVVGGTPAAGVGVQAGDIITQVNGTATPTNAIFLHLLQGSRAGQSMPLSWWSAAQDRQLSGVVTLAAYPGNATRGFLGVAPSYLSPSDLVTTMATPWASSSGAFSGFLTWVILPPAYVEPVQGPTVTFYHATGPLASLGIGNVWILANVLYWLTWINLLLGLSNGLPLIPLDGHLLFRDWVSGIAARFRTSWTAKQLDNFSGQATIAASLVIVFLLLWQFVAPRL
ncbi:MAG: site-2 protease family protein [Thermoplasmata archaeon]|nr:site-2 protease family protein [Thermoplasmata archaeon]